MDKFNSLLQPLISLLADPRTVILFSLLIVASVIDYRTYKIPNWQTLGGMAFGLMFNTASVPRYIPAIHGPSAASWSAS